MARFRHEVTVAAVPRRWFEEAVANGHDFTERMLDGTYRPPSFRQVEGDGLRPGARYEAIPERAEDPEAAAEPVTVEIVSWEHPAATGLRVIVPSGLGRVRWEGRTRGAGRPRLLGIRGDLQGEGRLRGYRRIELTAQADLWRWWAMADSRTARGEAPAQAVLEHRLARAVIRIAPRRTASGRWTLTTTVTVHGRGWAAPLVALGLAVRRSAASAWLRRRLDVMASDWNAVIPIAVRLNPAEVVKSTEALTEAARTLQKARGAPKAGAEPGRGTLSAPWRSDLELWTELDDDAARESRTARERHRRQARSARNPLGTPLVIGLMLLGAAWFCLGWAGQDLQATRRAGHGEVRPGTLFDVTLNCRSGDHCTVGGRFVSDDGSVVRQGVDYAGPRPGFGVMAVPAVDIGDFDSVYPPGVVPGPLNWSGPMLIGLSLLIVAGVPCLAAWPLRAREPWFARRVPRTPPPDAIEVVLYDPRPRAAGAVVASCIVLLATTPVVTALTEWGLRTEQVLGFTFIAALSWVCALGAVAQQFRALIRRPRLWLTPDELILREPATLAADLRVPRRDLERAQVETRPRERYRARPDAAEPSPYNVSANLEIRLRRPVGPLPLQSGWNGDWSWRFLASGRTRMATHPYLPERGHTYGVLRLRAHDPEQAAATIGVWAGQSFSTGA